MPKKMKINFVFFACVANFRLKCCEPFVNISHHENQREISNMIVIKTIIYTRCLPSTIPHIKSVTIGARELMYTGRYIICSGIDSEQSSM
jgi:hypothetical protein